MNIKFKKINKCNELETQSKSKISRRIDGFQKVAKLKHVVHDKNSNFLPGRHSILQRRIKFFSRLLNVYVFSKVTQTNTHREQLF
jgi:hypothetical protein